MKSKFKWVALATLLSACTSGAGEDVDGTQNSEGIETISYSDLASINDDLRFASARLFVGQGATPDLPASGTAAFVGTATFSENARPQILAAALLQANFSDDSLSGTIAGLRGEDGTEFDGILIISNGSISRTGSSIVADIDGQLTSSSAARLTVDVAGGFDGRFIGDNHTYVRGNTSVEWITNGGTATEETRTMRGEITAEKQF